ncbi:hypothetical protein T31B1_03785 [Salinisphaera sp. T31B1]
MRRSNTVDTACARGRGRPVSVARDAADRAIELQRPGYVLWAGRPGRLPLVRDPGAAPTAPGGHRIMIDEAER